MLPRTSSSWRRSSRSRRGLGSRPAPLAIRGLLGLPPLLTPLDSHQFHVTAEADHGGLRDGCRRGPGAVSCPPGPGSEARAREGRRGGGHAGLLWVQSASGRACAGGKPGAKQVVGIDQVGLMLLCDLQERLGAESAEPAGGGRATPRGAAAEEDQGAAGVWGMGRVATHRCHRPMEITGGNGCCRSTPGSGRGAGGGAGGGTGRPGPSGEATGRGSPRAGGAE